MANRILRISCALAVAGAAVLVTAVPAAADTIRDRQWHLGYLKVAQLHDITQGQGVTIAVIDTGVDAAHPDLKGSVSAGRSFGRVASSDPHHDDKGHGTAMASLIAAHGHGSSDGVLGIAPRARILPIKVPLDFGDNLIMPDAIRWAVDQGATVINISSGNEIADSDERAAIEYALQRNVVVVASAGNTDQGIEDVKSPARIPGVVAVSGTDQNGRFTDASVEGPEVVIAAPAVDIMAAGAGQRGKYAAATGTSGAAAIVSGVVALIQAKYPKLNAASVINRLVSTADDSGPKGRDPQYGHGTVNPLAALTEDLLEVDRNPLFPPPADARDAPVTLNDTPTAAVLAFAGAGLAALLAILGTIILIRRSKRVAPAQPRVDYPHLG